MRIVARKVTWIPSGYDPITLGKVDIDDYTLLTEESFCESSQSFRGTQNVSVFNTLSELQEDALSARNKSPGEDQPICRGSIIVTSTILRANTLALNNLASDQKLEHSAITKCDFKSFLYQAKPTLIENSIAKVEQSLRDFSNVFV